MKQKIFKKYFFATLAIIVFSLSILLMILLFVFNNYLSESKYEVLNKSCDSVTEYLSNSKIQNQKNILINLMNTISSTSEIDVFITDSKGIVKLCGCDECFNKEYCHRYGARVSGNTIAKAANGEFKEYSTLGLYDNVHFAVGKPINNTDGSVSAVVFSAASITAVRGLISTILKFYLMSAVIPITIMFFAIYAMTYRLVRPLKLMSEATKAMAKGDFSKRIPVTSDDEIGELAVSFNLMTNSLVQLEGMRRSFVANVSHEIKTPMTTIGGFIDGIIDGTIDEEKQSYYLGIVSEEVKRLSRLVQSMLSMAKLESGEYVLKREIFDFRELLFTIVISQEQRIENKKINIIGLDTLDSVSVNADKDLLHQVIYNLVDNAIKFTPEEGEITFSLDVVGKRISFKVINTGKGIPENELRYVFERFYKVDKSRSANKNSTGLGLYIARNIVSAHGGKITVSSKENATTTFTVDLPS